MLPCWFHGLWFLLVSRLIRFDVIIGVDDDCPHVHEACRRHNVRVHHHLRGLGLLCVRLHSRALRELSGCHGVTRIWADSEVRALLDVAVPASGAAAVASRYTGKGVTIAVVDTGIDPHPDLEGRIIGFRDMVGNRTAPYDDNGHGTHVAGCAAGSGAQSEGRYRGAAPGAQLVGVKVLNKFGSGSMSTMLAGINWVVQNKEMYGIRIMSMSLGAQAQAGCSDDPLCQAVGRVWQAGIVVVVAAGNEGPGAGSISTPGIHPQVITVGAMDDQGTVARGDDSLAAFSSRGPTPDGLHKPEILAPGVGITSLRAAGSYLDKTQPDVRVGRWYATLSGTSMATPIVSGIVALLLEARPALSPDGVKQALAASAENRGLLPDEQGAGYVDAQRLLAPAGAAEA
jgi:serine protease AprX